MILNLKQFTNTLKKISAFASSEKSVPGVLLDIRNDYINVCYSDGRRSIIERIDARIDRGDKREKIVIKYQRIIDIINACQPSGTVYVDEIEFIFEAKNVIKIRVEKKIPERDSEDYGIIYRTFSVLEQSINWVPAGADMRVSILSRINYDSIFDCDETDEWGISDFRDILAKISTEKGRINYISPKKECAFVSNRDHTSCIPIKSTKLHPLIFTYEVANELYSILGKISLCEYVYIHGIDRKFCNIFSEDKRVGICVEMPEANHTNIITLNRYESKKYYNYQMTFIKEIIKNVIDAAMMVDRADKTVLRFGKSNIEDYAIELKITSTNTGASISNDYNVLCSGCVDPENNIGSLELPISLKVLSDILSKCDSDFIGVDIDIDETGDKCIRVSDIDLDKRANAESEVKARLRLDVDEPTPMDEQLKYRAKTLVGAHYMTTVK